MYSFLPEHPVEALQRRKVESVKRAKSRKFHELLLIREEANRIRKEEKEHEERVVSWAEIMRIGRALPEGKRQGVPIQVHQRQTSVARLGSPSIQQQYRFRGVESERLLWGKAVVADAEFLGPVVRFVECGEDGLVSENSETGEVRLSPTTCGCRFCPACGIRRRREAGERLNSKLPPGGCDDLKFLTVTMKSEKGPLKPQLDHMVKSLRRLRSSTEWKNNVEYGWGVIECTMNMKTGLWHPHFHMLIKLRTVMVRGKKKASFWCKYEISDAWMKASRGSFVIKIKALKDAKGGANYITKYIGKGPDIMKAKDPLAAAIDWVRAIKGRRMMIGFGHPPPLPERPDEVQDDNEEANWVLIGPLLHLFSEARAGAERGLRILPKLFPGITKEDYAGPVERAPP